MILVPRWLTLLVAALVIAFGLYRMRVARRSATDNEREMAKKGLYALPRRTHALFGVLYLVLGGFLIASAFGYKPF